MTFIPSLTFTELWVVSMEHLQRAWLASRERLPFRTPGSVPHFGTCWCSNCWDQIPRTCYVFTRLFTSNTPWYFLDFAPFLSSNTPASPAYGVFISQFILYYWACFSCGCFILKATRLSNKFFEQWYVKASLKRHWRSFMVDTGILSNHMKFLSHEY